MHWLYLLLFFGLLCDGGNIACQTHNSRQVTANTQFQLFKGVNTTHTKLDSDSGDSLFAKNAKPQLLSDQFSFTEGPAVDAEGNVYFTDQPNDKIWKYDLQGNLTVFLEKAGRSNGLYFDRKGNLIACADEKNELWSISPKKKVTVIVKDQDGLFLNGPNDLWIHPKGTIYFTDPYYKRSYWSPDKSHVKGEKVYYLQKGSSKLQVADEDLVKPNGIIGTPDGKLLYVADIGDKKTYKYRIEKDGSLSNRQLFFHQGSDGMTIDNKGNVYVTGNGVDVYNREGNKIAHIDIPAKWTANVCFGGKKRNKLFITASESFYVLDMLVKGVQ